MTDDRVFAKCAWRLMPLIIIAYVFNYLDRTNIGFAALTMNRDLGFSPSVYGFGAGVFFISYSIFQVPANLVLHRVGARRWICAILIGWGAAATAGALISGPYSLYMQRFVLGVAEAGFFPGIILYLTYWFPKAWLCRTTSMFMAASTTATVITGPLASVISLLAGVAGIRAWQWLFLLEGLPAVMIAAVFVKVIPDNPQHAGFLSSREKQWITTRLKSESSAKESKVLRSLANSRVLALGIAYGGILFLTLGFAFWLPLIIRNAGFSDAETGFVAALVQLAAVPAMVLWGQSSDRRGDRSWHVIIACLVSAAGALVASVAHNNLLLLPALAAAAIGANSTLAPFYTLAPLFLRGPAMAGGFALVSSIGTLIGGFVGQYVLGVIRQLTGGYAVPLASMAAGIVIAAVIVRALDRSIQPRPAAVPAAAE